MRRKNKKTDELPYGWDVVEEGQDPDEIPPPFVIVSETQDSDEDAMSELSQDPLELTVTYPKLVYKQTKESACKRKLPRRPKKVTANDKKTQTKNLKRTKSKRTVLDKSFRKGKSYCNVVCRLSSICSDPLLVEEIQRTTRAMKQIQMETWHLVNLHTLRSVLYD
ncbi:Hypothetical protein PHPALM_1809 [Phytophthora palmivora]|uniref:Uncharacterized protein n=1 Tax=Phytophthora palmivora TaxID=4796 RepID=A0A2P4YRB0_9STRA|nr:Hypothetical protein PHPALM_1809 [Phytophthora palmivora]